ncbi:TIP41-like protein [Mya arenaria]|uniref:TIP41-like protein n=1 Tax=Mya arenaria TaxID=6604 RepID=UPI0022E6FD51|nr:TIP41-like protein [Mya arenaria]XP_052810358.1 TIP41-like protein [Mya arenaria]
MASSNVHGPARPRAGPITTQFQFGPWTLTAVKSHILESEGTARERFEGQLDLPQVPEMVFAENVLRIQHTEGYGVEFNALDALRRVDPHHDHFKVAVSQAWKEARSECEHIQDVVKPFDWTFTTDYKGTIIGDQIQVETTSERIDLEKLKVREKIHFYEDIVLFEDELSDNGTSMMSVKIRVMPSSFFILLRQFMRVDNVIVRVLDTRLYLEAEQNYMLREHSCREKNIQDLKVPAHVITDPNELAQILPVSKEMNEKLVFPSTGGTKEETDSAVR